MEFNDTDKSDLIIAFNKLFEYLICLYADNEKNLKKILKLKKQIFVLLTDKIN